MIYNDEMMLIRDLRNYRPEAWDWGVRRYSGEVYSLIFHLCGRHTDVAEDLSQEVWLEAMDHFSQFDSARGKLRDWLLGIARLRVAMHYRRAANCRPKLDDTAIAHFSDDDLLPDQLLAQIERADAVRASLITLSEDRRTVLQLKYVDGFSVQQIASHVGKSAKAVESLLTRARDQIRRLLRHYYVTNEPGKSHEPTVRE